MADNRLRRNHGSQHCLTTEVLAKVGGLYTVHMCILGIFIPFFCYSGFSSTPRGAITLFCSQYSREVFHQIARRAFTSFTSVTLYLTLLFLLDWKALSSLPAGTKNTFLLSQRSKLYVSFCFQAFQEMTNPML